MNPILKGAIAFGTVAGVGGTSYGIYNAIQPAPEKVTTYADKFNKETLLSTSDATNQTKWQSRLDAIKGLGDSNGLVNELKAIKSKNTLTKWEDLKNWCAEVIKKKNKGGKEFENIQNYCTYSIKEKITDAVDDSASGSDDSKWNVALGKLKAINNAELTSNLINAKVSNTKVKEWCVAAYKKPYKGADDKDFKNASRICLSK